jgi:hypothetical protein
VNRLPLPDLAGAVLIGVVVAVSLSFSGFRVGSAVEIAEEWLRSAWEYHPLVCRP